MGPISDSDERHGSVAGYYQHYRNGPWPACMPCTDARNKYQREYKRDYREKQAQEAILARRITELFNWAMHGVKPPGAWILTEEGGEAA